MELCPRCKREVKDSSRGLWALQKEKPYLFHAGCLRSKLSRSYLEKAREYAKKRVARLMSDWRFVLGQWMELGGYPCRVFYSCPVCDFFIPGGSYFPALKSNIWEVEGVTVCAYTCGVCGYFLPELPTEGWDYDLSFAAHWKIIKSISGGEVIDDK